MSGGRRWLLLPIALLVLVLSSARADQRQEVSVKQYPWSTVARVGFGHGWCSAVLIGPKLAATAAHCLWNKATHRNMEAAALNVVVGWDRGQLTDGSGVARVVVSPRWVPDQVEHYGPEQAAKDWALLELDKPLGDEVGWVALSDQIKPGQPIATVGYGNDHKHAAVAHQGCTIMEHLSNGIWMHNCDAIPGDSGGPVYADVTTTPKLIAITVARFAENRGAAIGAAEFIAQARKLGAAKQNGVKSPLP